MNLTLQREDYLEKTLKKSEKIPNKPMNVKNTKREISTIYISEEPQSKAE